MRTLAFLISLDGISASEWTGLIGAIAALVAASGVFFGAREYKLKSEAQRVEIDVNLSKLLAELIPTANGRGESVISETAAEVVAKEHGDGDLDKLAEALKSAIVTLPVGEATQAVAIISIGSLGAAHGTLLEPARQALLALDFFADGSKLERSRREALELVEANGK